MDKNPRPNLSSDEEYLKRARDLIKGRGELEDIHFEYLTEALFALGVDADVYKGVSSVSIPPQVKESVDTAFKNLELRQPDSAALEKLYRLWDYLAESDLLKKADLIYVFGGISENAVREAIRLKKENFAPRILFSGKHGSYMKDVTDLSEAEKYAQLALDSGVPSAEILLEKESINTVENAVNSCRLLHSIGWLPKTIIAVSLPYHMKRASLTLRAGLDWEFKLVRHPGPSAKYTRETYFKDKNGWSYICFEYIKLRMAREGGHF